MTATQRTISAAEFTQLVEPLKGLRITHAWRGAGTALFLELGQLRRNYALRIDGEMVLVGTVGRATVMIEFSWRIERPRSIRVGTFSTDRRIDNAIARLPGVRIRGFALDGRLPELRIELDNAEIVASFMTAERQPSWVVFLPDSSWLTVERGRIVQDTQNQEVGRRHRATPRRM